MSDLPAILASAGGPAALEVLRLLPAFVGVHSSDGKLLWVNRYDYGLGPGETLGRRVEEQLPGADTASWYAALGRATAGDAARYTIGAPVAAAPGHATWAGVLAPLAPGLALSLGWDVCDDAAGGPLARRFLTPTGRAVVRFLDRHGPARGGAIARGIGQETRRGQAGSALRALLRHLLDRGVLVRARGGYALAPELRPLLPWVAPPEPGAPDYFC